MLFACFWSVAILLCPVFESNGCGTPNGADVDCIKYIYGFPIHTTLILFLPECYFKPQNNEPVLIVPNHLADRTHFSRLVLFCWSSDFLSFFFFFPHPSFSL